MGYVDLDQEMYTFVGDYFKVLIRAKAIISDAYAPIKYKHLTPDEQKRWDENEKKKKDYEIQRRKFMEEKKKKDEYIKQLKEGSINDRKEVSQREVKASKANTLNFGYNLI